MELKEIFGERLKKLRGTQKQEDVAKKLGISRASLGYYENGSRTPDIEVLKTICRHFNVSSDYLLGLATYRSTGEQIEMDVAKNDISRIFDELDVDGQHSILEIVKNLIRSYDFFTKPSENLLRAEYLKRVGEIVEDILTLCYDYFRIPGFLERAYDEVNVFDVDKAVDEACKTFDLHSNLLISAESNLKGFVQTITRHSIQIIIDEIKNRSGDEFTYEEFEELNLARKKEARMTKAEFDEIAKNVEEREILVGIK